MVSFYAAFLEHNIAEYCQNNTNRAFIMAKDMNIEIL
jgi:hypothetical protein